MELHLIPHLEQRLQEPLPGLDAQMLMAPGVRGRTIHVPDNVRKGGVLALLYPQDGIIHTVFMLRTEDGGSHSGQVSFPGGRHEQEDASFVATALREAEEEMSIPANEVQVLGQLTELYIPPSNYLVYPTVGFLDRRPDFVPDPTEVAKIIEADIPLLANDDRREREVMIANRFPTRAPSFLVDGHVIWGATSMMLSELLTIINEVEIRNL